MANGASTANSLGVIDANVCRNDAPPPARINGVAHDRRDCARAKEGKKEGKKDRDGEREVYEGNGRKNARARMAVTKRRMVRVHTRGRVHARGRDSSSEKDGLDRR